MGDIVAVQGQSCKVSANIETGSPVLSIDVLRGMEVVRTTRTYAEKNLGTRYRACFHCAEYRGRGRQTTWAGQIRVSGAKIVKFETVNAWNHDKMLRVAGPSCVEFDLLTAGNFIGFDIWLDGAPGALDITTTLINQTVDLAKAGIDPIVLKAGGLDRKVSITRLPEELSICSVQDKTSVDLMESGDTPLWVHVATEDGQMAWSSPIYLFRDR